MTALLPVYTVNDYKYIYMYFEVYLCTKVILQEVLVLESDSREHSGQALFVSEIFDRAQ